MAAVRLFGFVGYILGHCREVLSGLYESAKFDWKR